MSLHLLHYADVENAFDTPERVGRLVGTVDALRDESTLVTGSGDNTAPGVLSLVTSGRHARFLFDAVEPAVDTFGNHDFDHGLDALRETVKTSPQTWLTANLQYRGERLFADRTEPRTLVETPDATVGFVGVTTPDLHDLCPEARDVAVSDPVDAVAEHVPKLREASADHVVILSHSGVPVDERIAANTGVDAVLGGHDHEELVEHVDGTLVLHPGQGGTHLLEAEFDADGEPTARHHETSEFPADEEVVDAVRTEAEAAGLTDVVAHWEEPVLLTERARKQAESTVGNLLMDAHRWQTDADVALCIGGIREDTPLQGDVTVADLVGLVPYGNDIVVCEVDGETLRDALHQLSVAYRYPDAGVPWFGHVSGVRLAWDDRDQTLRDAQVGGEAIDSEAAYEVALSRYFVDSDHLFSVFDPDDVVRTVGQEHEAVVDYVREHPERPRVDGRVERPFLDETRPPIR
ncbi:bifunctional metallophosphatase/5'-nucleotidase [Halospeciosus flavus]|uniref:Bifunctional metallophosphatase/5'-nucleotidase n=1 Tax=Halospeciosus flavus TaxID=3032283 RepID=A0ABD5Z229_9EURY|nr:bifunctional metallophosphatase/5'-nucleotidase [Halospeciosus flavus]